MPYKNIEDKKKYEKKYYLTKGKLRKQIPKKILIHVCTRCSKEYNAGRKNQKFCSKTCQNNIHCKKKRYTNELYKIRHNVRSRLRKIIKNKQERTSNLIGCSWVELKQHLESKWQQGMCWENYGLHGWHIDHIIPLQAFNLSNKDELFKACHYTNLQPLWAKDNLSKGIKHV